ncbi:hypothetical protein SASPL_137284 [Salvia splendens]|uniref:AT-hook motif nuclear-localized protein n=1 Tax=Salvia splendens TaxID=180675 RepID=A0A8X8ZCT5_SALSN|nr:hypothetical protein SASPL_137284 [Salvia splendens]
MDQREAIPLQGSASYYLHQGNAVSFMGLQGSLGINSLSNPGFQYQTNMERDMMGSSFPLDTSSTMSPHEMSAAPPPAVMQGEPVCRKRGRPRKYGRDSVVSLALSPSTPNPVPFVRPTQKQRRRPPGMGRKHQRIPLGGSIFTRLGKLVPHVINVAVGEVTVILSGNGTISAVNISRSSSGRSVTYEGCFDILSLTGSYVQNDVDVPQGPVGCLNVTLSGLDGLVIGGGVDGVMLAGSPVQVVVGSLLPRTSKTKNIAAGTSADSEDCTVGNLAVPDNA